MTIALQDKVVLVTGGGGGIGRAICLDCARNGAKVVVLSPGRNGEETAQLAAAASDAVWVRGDVTVARDVEAAVATAVDAFGRLDGVVHNATSRWSSDVGAIGDLTDDVFADHIAVSLRGAYLCARAALPALQASNGRFIVMISPAGIEGSAARPAYSAVKAALRGFAKSLALEWGPLGVTVAAVSPLAMTPAMADAYRADPGLEARLTQLVPLNRMGDPAADIAPVVRFLLHEDSDYITGQTITVDGGRFTAL